MASCGNVEMQVEMLTYTKAGTGEVLDFTQYDSIADVPNNNGIL